MGSVQRLATVVVVGLVALSTILFLYLGDENNRIETEAAEQQALSIERGRTNYISLCLSCHGPAGEGYTEPGAIGTGRIGAPLGGINTSLNQHGINSQGTPVAGGFAARTSLIRETITNGRKNPDGTYRMPPFSDANAGPLNDEQINQLVLLIQYGDWNETYNAAVEASGGYPTPPPAPGAGATATAQAEAGSAPTAAPATGGGSEAGQEVTIAMHDIFFDPAEVTIPANTPVKVILPNEGAALHDFSIDALGISVTVNPGETGDVTINAPAGEYDFYCNIPGHKEAGMIGKLIVKEGAGGAAAPAAAESTTASTSAAPAAGSEAAAAQDVTVTMHDIYFDPAEFTIPANTPVKVILPNDGAAPHDFSIDALGISVAVNPGDTGEVTINAPAGEYDFYCNIPGHKDAGMVGKLTVAEGGGAAAPAAAESEQAAPAAATEAPAAPAASGGESAASAADVTVTMHDIFFDPAEFTIPANTPVKVILPNVGAAPHDFSIDALNISVTVNPGDTGEVTINAPAGEYDFYCNIPGHKEAGMVGKLTVK